MEADTARSETRLGRIAQLEVLRARTEAQISREMLAYVDECRGEAEKYADPKLRELEASAAADELALVVRQPTRTVQGRIAQARGLRAKLPRTALAHALGRFDGFRVAVISEHAAKLKHPDSLLKLDARVADYAATHTVAQLRAWLRRFVARTEPEAAGSRQRRAHADRCAWVQHEADGISWLHAQLSTTDAHRIDRILTTVGQRLSDKHSDTSLEQARSDALAGLLLGRIDETATATGRARPGATIGITVPVTTLWGLSDQPGVSFDGEFALPAELVRELANEPGTLFYRIMTDPLGRILDVSELGRFPSQKLRTAIAMRDGVCRFPTCSRPAADCDLDHEIPHPRGPTSGGNLQPLCRRHHRLKSHGLLPEPELVSSRLEHRLARFTIDYVQAA